MTAFETRGFLRDEDTVVVFGGESGTVRATGEPLRNEWCQQYVVSANQIVRMVEYNVQVEPT
jgi:ketosteroid isomerase-like protein